jgi:HSP20 family protein
MVTRWSPFEEALSLRDAMNRLFETSVVRPGYWTAATSAAWQGFPLNIYSRNDELVVEALLPGISQEDVQVAIDQGVLTIAATRHGWQGDQPEGAAWHLREIAPGQFKRALSLPFPVDTEKAGAAFSNGMLTLTLPKAEAARPKQIRIQAGEPTQVEAAQG